MLEHRQSNIIIIILNTHKQQLCEFYNILHQSQWLKVTPALADLRCCIRVVYKLCIAHYLKILEILRNIWKSFNHPTKSNLHPIQTPKSMILESCEYALVSTAHTLSLGFDWPSFSKSFKQLSSISSQLPRSSSDGASARSIKFCF